MISVIPGRQVVVFIPGTVIIVFYPDGSVSLFSVHLVGLYVVDTVQVLVRGKIIRKLSTGQVTSKHPFKSLVVLNPYSGVPGCLPHGICVEIYEDILIRKQLRVSRDRSMCKIAVGCPCIPLGVFNPYPCIVPRTAQDIAFLVNQAVALIIILHPLVTKLATGQAAMHHPGTAVKILLPYTADALLATQLTHFNVDQDLVVFSGIKVSIKLRTGVITN